MTAKIIRLKTKNKKIKAPRIGIVIQARMTSVRFPGKSMAKLFNKPVLEHVINRAKHIRPSNIVVLAVPDTVESEPMLVLATKMGIENFCGPEHNVLKRYYDAACFHELDIIVRITGDCPFIDPFVCSQVVQLLLWRRVDYASNIHPIRTYPKGLDCEAFTMDCLDCAYKLCDNPYDMEHVTPWMQREKELRTAVVQQNENRSSENWCVDVPEDIERLEALIKEPANVKN